MKTKTGNNFIVIAIEIFINRGYPYIKKFLGHLCYLYFLMLTILELMLIDVLKEKKIKSKENYRLKKKFRT